MSINHGYIRKGALALLAVSLIAAVLYNWGGLGPQKVVGLKVEIGTLQPTVFGIGTVQVKMNYNVGPTQTGKISKLYVDQGDNVKAGQIIGEIDPVDLEQRIASNSAALVSSQHDLEVAWTQIQDARSRNQLAQTEAKRYARLFESGAVSKELLETKQNNAEVAQAALDAAMAAFQSAQSKVMKASADYQGQIEQRRNMLLMSPVDGVVVSRQAEAGSTVIAGQTVFTIIDPKTLWVQTRIDQSRFAGIALDQTANIVLRSKQNEILPGKVARLEMQGDTLTEERFVDVKFVDDQATVFLGDLAEVTIQLPEIPNSLYIPVAAVKRANGQDGVWVVKNEKAAYKLVKTGVQTIDGKMQIISGLEPGEIVITYTKTPIAEGMRVRLVSAL